MLILIYLSFPHKEEAYDKRTVRPTILYAHFYQIYTEKDEPHPHVVVAFGFLITNCEPSNPSV